MDENASRPGGRGLLAKKFFDKEKEATPSPPGPVSSVGRGILARLKAAKAERDHTVSQAVPPLVSRLQQLQLSNRNAANEEDYEVVEREFTNRYALDNAANQATHNGHAKVPQSASKISTNYIKVSCDTSMVHHYHVYFEPDLASKLARIKIIDSLDTDQFSGMPPAARIFDGRSLYLPNALENKITVFNVNLADKQQKCRVTLKLVTKIVVESMPGLFNKLFKKVQSHLKMVRVGRNYFYPDNKIGIPSLNLEVWPGYVTAINRFEGGLLLMVDVSHRVVRTDTVYDALANYIRSNDNRAFTDAVVGTSVLTRYNNRVYKIDDVAHHMNPSSTLTLDDGKVLTFRNYFNLQYGLQVRDETQPLLISRTKMPRVRERGSHDRKTSGIGSMSSVSGDGPAAATPRLLFLIPELCYQTGLTDNMRKDFNLMRNLSNHTKASPAVRRKTLMDFCDSCKSCPEAAAILNAWGIRIDPLPMEVPGRQLAAERITFGNGRSCVAGESAEFKREIQTFPVIRGCRIDNWLFLCLDRDMPKASEFLEVLIKRGSMIGIQFSRPILVKLNSDSSDSFLRAIDQNMTRDTKLVMVVFKQVREDRYNAIKKLLYTEKAVASQMVLLKTISEPRKMASVATNVALQMNVKLGGELWAVPIPIDKIMMIGLDTYHEGTGSTRRSVVGFVGSLNLNCTKYYSQAVFQAPRQEIMLSTYQCVGNLLKRYYEVNNFLPETIFVYRDGVGDGQLFEVQQNEVKQLLEAIQSFSQGFAPGYSPSLIFQVVQKRISTRLYGMAGKEVGNPRPGTVVDRHITRRNTYDFFLVPQTVRQGTATPSHFIVLHDSSSFEPDVVQSMAFKACHLYYNWAGTVRVPAPCQYAHKLAYMAGQNLRKAVNPDMLDKLYYL